MSRKPIVIAMLLAATISGENRLIEGNPKSSVRVVIYEDLQCSDCAAFGKMLDEHLLPRFGARAAFEHMDFPLTKHPWARRAAAAARFFESVKPELGVSFRRQTMARLESITVGNFLQHLEAFAKANQVDPAKAAAAIYDAKLATLVEDDYQDGVARGIAKTPTVLVNGTPFVEVFTVEEISKVIEEALREAKQ
ncbi:MAG: thioredoxin domain-containing protein [Acidobacteriia bacterium]|nr:thioredoxin domain-containing protein [Terriglobia bacterium]